MTSVIEPGPGARRRGESLGRRSRGAGLVFVTEAVENGGTERVIQALADRYPAARIIAGHFGEPSAEVMAAVPWSVRAELVRLGDRKHHHLMPLYARRLSRRAIGRADLVLTFSGSGWALAAQVPPGARHLCYSAGLPRAFYGGARDYRSGYRWHVHLLLRAALPPLRRHHRRLIARPDRVIVNSHVVAPAVAALRPGRVDVVHPPVCTEFFTPSPGPPRAPRHALAVARIVAQKQLDLLMDAFRGLDGALVVAGTGPALEKLRRAAPPNVRFLGQVSDHRLRELYRESYVLICPTVEEFGIVMAEAHACGVPVIAPRRGGALEIVRDGWTGVLLDHVDPGSVAEAVRRVRAGRFSPRACREAAERFAEQRFLTEMEQIIDEELALVARAARNPQP